MGGIKEKLLAAHRSGIRRVLVPDANVKDLEEIAPAILKELEVVPSEQVLTNVCEALLDENAAAPVTDVEEPSAVELRVRESEA